METAQKRTVMKTKALLGLFFALALSASAQEKKETIYGSGNFIKEKRAIADYNKIRVNGPFEVILTDGVGDMAMQGEDNLIALTATEVNNGTLYIGIKGDQPVKTTKNTKITIKIPYIHLTEIVLKGDGSVTARRVINNDNLKVMVEGSGSISLSAYSANITAWVLGAGDITIGGKADHFNCKVIGSGTVKANRLKSQYTDAVVSGPGDAHVNSSKAIKGRIDGSGNIAFAGNPHETDLKLAGSGKFSAY